jgi:hypothetical protein
MKDKETLERRKLSAQREEDSLLFNLFSARRDKNGPCKITKIAEGCLFEVNDIIMAAGGLDFSEQNNETIAHLLATSNVQATVEVNQ